MTALKARTKNWKQVTWHWSLYSLSQEQIHNQGLFSPICPALWLFMWQMESHFFSCGELYSTATWTVLTSMTLDSRHEQSPTTLDLFNIVIPMKHSNFPPRSRPDCIVLLLLASSSWSKHYKYGVLITDMWNNEQIICTVGITRLKLPWTFPLLPSFPSGPALSASLIPAIRHLYMLDIK